MRIYSPIILLILWSSWGLLAAESGKILQTTESQRTVIVNYGSGDGIVTGDVAKFFYKPGFFKDNNLYVGEGRAIKVFPNRSFWVLNYSEKNLKFERGDLIVLFKIKGRDEYLKKMKVKRRKFVADTNIDNHTNFILEEDGPKVWDRYQHLGNDYKSNPTLQLLRPRGKEAINLYELDRWQYRKKNDFLEDRIQNSYFFYPKSVYKVSRDNEFLKQTFLEDIELMIRSHFQMIGNPEVNLLDYLKGHSKDIDIPLLYSKLAFYNTFDERMFSRKQLEKEREEYKSYLVGKSKKWSKYYSDEDLAKATEKMGIMHETIRQKIASSTKISNEIYGAYYRGVYNNSLNKFDTNRNYRKKNSSINIGYEFNLQKVEPLFFEYSLLFSFRRIVNYGSIGDENGKIVDRNLSLHGLFYPWQHPGRLRRLIPYAGFGFGYGFSYIRENNEFLNNYNTLIFPSLLMGLKYRFHMNYGIKFDAIYENASYKMADSKKNPEMPGSASVSDLKLGIGLNLYF